MPFAVDIMYLLSGADGPSESEYDIVHKRTSHPCIAGLSGTDRIHSNSYTNTHRLIRRLPLDKQCRSAIIISTTVICHLKDPEYTASWRQSAAMPSTTCK